MRRIIILKRQILGFSIKAYALYYDISCSKNSRFVLTLEYSNMLSSKSKCLVSIRILFLQKTNIRCSSMLEKNAG